MFESSSWVNKPCLLREVDYRRGQTRKKTPFACLLLVQYGHREKKRKVIMSKERFLVTDYLIRNQVWGI